MNNVHIEILKVAKSIQRTGTQASCSLTWLHFRSPGLPNKLRKTYICAVATGTTNDGHRQHGPCTYSKKTGCSPPGTSCKREKTKKKERKEIFQTRRKIVSKSMFESETDWIRNQKSANGEKEDQQ